MPQVNNFNTIILLKGFSTYFDRKIFFYDTYADYKSHAVAYFEQEDINFNPNDGITTKVDLSTLDDQLEETADALSFSYLLVLDPADDSIISRWYVMDAIRNTAGIYSFVLRRDVVAESINNETFRKNAPVYIEKAMLQETIDGKGNYLIFNKEDFNCNRIKASEYLIQDKSQCGWIIGYMQNSAAINLRSLPQSPFAPSTYYTANQIATATGIDLADINALLSGGIKQFSNSDPTFVFGIALKPLVLINLIRCEYYLGNTLEDVWGYGVTPAVSWSNAVGAIPLVSYYNDYLDRLQNYFSGSMSNFRTNFDTILNGIVPGEKYYDEAQYNKLKEFDGKYVLLSGVYYRIKVRRGNTYAHPEVVIGEGTNAYFNDAASSMLLDEYYSDWELYVNYNVGDVNIELEAMADYDIKYQISSSHNSLKDAPYSMFAIPYGDHFYMGDSGGGLYEPQELITKEDAMRIATDIAEQLGKSNLIDLQLLPYFPDFDYWYTKASDEDLGGNWYLNCQGKTITVDYDNITYFNGNDDDIIGVIVYPKISSFTVTGVGTTIFNKSRYIPGRNPNPALGRFLTSYKAISELYSFRLCSPNYSGVFEFNLAKTGRKKINGDDLIIDCTYKPFNPYIRIAPPFDALYGHEFHDGRGLICGGDFSLPFLSDAYVEYQVQNKSFASIFSRDIQNLDFSLKQEAFREPFTLAAGMLGGMGAGAAAGGKMGGDSEGGGGGKGSAIGSGIGAAIGLTVGTIGAAIDSNLNTARRAETKDYALDRFSLNLQNIKALPDSLVKNSSFHINSKIWPFVEVYECANVEREALRKKLIYDGMTVNVIGTIDEYYGGNDNPKYFKGQLIRAEGIYEDNHYVSTLYEELAKGVYI